jgi:hypothetical protein
MHGLRHPYLDPLLWSRAAGRTTGGTAIASGRAVASGGAGSMLSDIYPRYPQTTRQQAHYPSVSDHSTFLRIQFQHRYGVLSVHSTETSTEGVVWVGLAATEPSGKMPVLSREWTRQGRLCSGCNGCRSLRRGWYSRRRGMWVSPSKSLAKGPGAGTSNILAVKL